MNDRSSFSLSGIEQVVLNELVSQSGLSQAKIASMLSINKSRLEQCPQDKLPDLDQNHIHLVAGVIHHGMAFFDQNITTFTKWLQTPHPELACPQTGFFPEWPTTPPPPLNEMTAFEPFDLIAYSARRDQQSATYKPTKQKRPYPTLFSLLNTAEGIELVDAIFGRIEAGVYM